MNNITKNNKIKLSEEERKAKKAAYQKEYNSRLDIKQKNANNQKLYRENNKEKLKIIRKIYCEKNKEILKERKSKWQKSKNARKYQKKYREKNKIKINQNNKIYYQQNKQKIKKYSKIYQNKRKLIDPAYKIAINYRRRVLLALKNNKKINNTIKLVGCTTRELKLHLESQFKEGMNWNNHGLKGWHIDHIKPCASFDLSDPEQQKQCFHYSNLQPLWWWENLSKGDKIIN